MNWKIAFALSAAVAALVPALAVGCGSDACDIADQELEACSLQPITPPSETLDCNAKRVCQAMCIDQATCAEINANLCIGQTLCPPAGFVDAGGDAGSGTTFSNCIAACEGQ
jgi:hypothetical protein